MKKTGNDSSRTSSGSGNVASCSTVALRELQMYLSETMSFHDSAGDGDQLSTYSLERFSHHVLKCIGI